MTKGAMRLLILLFILFAIPGSALAQNYSFSLNQETVNVFWNEDGTLSVDYVFVFSNDADASPIDFVDVGLPTGDYNLSNITADVDGHPITDIQDSPYVEHGIALGLGRNAIRPGGIGRVHIYVPTVRSVLHIDDRDSNYASAVFSPTWFDSSLIHGTTDLSVIFHFPPGVNPDEPRWHKAPRGFPPEPVTGFDEQGRITYTWRNPNANGYSQYIFGGSFPKVYVPVSAIVQPSPFAWVERINFEAFIPLFCFGFFGFIVLLGFFSDRRRKLRYLSPKITIEGHGIKRGLTAVEAAILMQEPMDKILTMILFAVVKKNAARVASKEPLEVERIQPAPEGLQPYEIDFLNAFDEKGVARRKALQKTMINLVRSLGQKMKGFSHRESVTYYRDIIKRAWSQVEAADTPKVKSEKFDEVMEWTMLDRDFEGRTRDVFRTGPVFVPVWWPRYDPGFGRAAPRPTTAPVSTPSGRGAPSLPHLPGSDFAATVVTGVQNFSSSVIGNLTEFTSGVTNVTNPPPKPASTGKTWRGGGGGCACACACAGCACACAGGGR